MKTLKPDSELNDDWIKHVRKEDEMKENKLPFAVWLKKVNETLTKYIGSEYDDVEDALWRDWYDDGISPEDAATEFLEENYPDALGIIEDELDEYLMDDFFDDPEFNEPESDLWDFL